MRTTILFALTIFAAQAGPPLICHPYQIGDAQSLPWGHVYERGWDNKDPGYDTSHLTADTLKILDSGSPVLVRMETLRRAVIYGERDHHSMSVLLAALKDRAVNRRAAALFDYGFAVETLKQMQWKYKEDLTGGVDGYAFVRRAQALDPGSADMAYAARIIGESPRRTD